MHGGNKTEEDALRIIGVVVCVLSMLGSLAIIVTYALLKDIRSKAREILVHISLMDATYTIANLVGLLAHRWDNGYVTRDNKLCQAQAFIAVYGTVSSVLWTLALAVYLYYKIVSRDDKVTKRLVRILYVVCYTLPLYVSLWLLLDDHLGYSEVTSGAGWCSLHKPPAIVELMTYDIWIWLGIVILLPLYLVVHTDIRDQVSQSHQYLERDRLAAITKADRKLLLVPLVFIFLRVWDIVTAFLFVYQDHNSHDYYWLQFLTAIGDSGQGFVNFVIFFLFQPTLRRFMMMNIYRCCCCCCKRFPWRHTQYEANIDDDDSERYSNIGNISEHPSTLTKLHD